MQGGQGVITSYLGTHACQLSAPTHLHILNALQRNIDRGLRGVTEGTRRHQPTVTSPKTFVHLHPTAHFRNVNLLHSE